MLLGALAPRTAARGRARQWLPLADFRRERSWVSAGSGRLVRAAGRVRWGGKRQVGRPGRGVGPEGRRGVRDRRWGAKVPGWAWGPRPALGAAVGRAPRTPW